MLVDEGIVEELLELVLVDVCVWVGVEVLLGGWVEELVVGWVEELVVGWVEELVVGWVELLGGGGAELLWIRLESPLAPLMPPSKITNFAFTP